jgi:tight adherence protein C
MSTTALVGSGIVPGALAAACVGLAGAIRFTSARPRPVPARAADDVCRRPAIRPGGRTAVMILGAALVGVMAGPAILIVAITGAYAIVRLRRRRVAADGRRAMEAAMPAATELLVACLHAGRSPTQSVVELARLAPGPVRPAFAAVEQRLHRGQGLADALGELTERCGRCALPLVTAMSAAVRDGLPLAPVLDRLTDEAHASRRRQGEAAARRLPVRLSFPLVTCTLPAFVLLSVAPAILGALSSLRDSPI